MSFGSLRRQINRTPHDVLYLNSFFSFAFAIKPLILRRLKLIEQRPVLLAPRGQFSHEAIALKRLKKRLYLALGKVLAVYGEVTWQATSAHEVDDIRRMIGDEAKIVLVEVPRVKMNIETVKSSRPRKKAGVIRIALLGRVTRMKNVHFALDCLSHLDGDVLFDVFGPLEDDSYWMQCQAVVRSMPANIHVHYRGVVPYEDVLSVLGGYDLFFLPSKGENFGHAIIDAMVSGCPVLISNRTPWRNLHERGCGWDIPLEAPDQFRSILKLMLAMDETELAKISEKAREFGREQILRADVIARNRDLFLSFM